MTYVPPRPIVSGVPYEVRDVDGRAPKDLSDFDGHVVMTVEGTTGSHIVRGDGTASERSARLHEKSEDGGGKDVRTWEVLPAAQGGFVAQTV